MNLSNTEWEVFFTHDLTHSLHSQPQYGRELGLSMYNVLIYFLCYFTKNSTR